MGFFAVTGELTYPWEADVSLSSGYRFNVAVGQRESGLPRCQISWRFTLKWPQQSSLTSVYLFCVYMFTWYVCLCVHSSALAVSWRARVQTIQTVRYTCGYRAVRGIVLLLAGGAFKESVESERCYLAAEKRSIQRLLCREILSRWWKK